MAEMAVLVAPNIETIRDKTENATTVNEQEKFDEIKAAIEDAAGAGSYEVVLREEIEELYANILVNNGYGVCIGKYNGTNKICTLIEWREIPKWKVENEIIVEA